jgi:hypothetical protein
MVKLIRLELNVRFAPRAELPIGSTLIEGFSPLPKIGGAYALIGSIALKYGNEERPPCGDWPRTGLRL